MWELEACVFCKGTCGEPVLDNRPVWVAGVCVSPVVCGVVGSVLAARLIAGSWAEPGLLGCGDVCWSISGWSDDFLLFLVLSGRLSPSDSL